MGGVYLLQAERDADPTWPRCRVNQCGRATVHRGGEHQLCVGHYSRWWDFGDVKADEPIQSYMGEWSLYCECSDPEFDRVGECSTCRRLVPSMSWHKGRRV